MHAAREAVARAHADALEGALRIAMPRMLALAPFLEEHTELWKKCKGAKAADAAAEFARLAEVLEDCNAEYLDHLVDGDRLSEDGFGDGFEDLDEDEAREPVRPLVASQERRECGIG